jgi:hypothetical protein
MADVRISSTELAALAKRLNVAADSDLLLSGVVEEFRSAIPELEREVVKGTSRLPERGGLAAQVAKTRIGFKLKTSQGTVRIRIVAHPNAVADPGSIDRGRVRKPVFGRYPAKPVIQLVPRGWFSEPITLVFAPSFGRRLKRVISKNLGKV